MSRASQFTEPLATYVLEQMGQGRTLVDICDFPDSTAPLGLPRSGIVRSWILYDECKVGAESFSKLYNVAREAMADSMFESLQSIGDRPLPGDRTELRTELGPDGAETVVRKIQTLDNTERTKIKVDVRKFIASKIKPASYGDRMAHQMLDENGNPAKAGITVIVDGAPGTT